MFGLHRWALGAREDEGSRELQRETWGEAEDLSSPFEDLLVHGLELGRRRGDELAGVRKPGDEGAAQHVDLAVDRRRVVAYGVEVTVKL